LLETIIGRLAAVDEIIAVMMFLGDGYGRDSVRYRVLFVVVLTRGLVAH